jgi:hypothetical protein
MHADPDVFGLQLVLLLGHNGGCNGEFTEAQLRRGWQVYRRELTNHAERPGGRPGTRPWAWVFDRGFEGEPDPEAAVAYLAEHGLLTEWEREALARIQPVGASLSPSGCGRRSEPVTRFQYSPCGWPGPG